MFRFCAVNSRWNIGSIRCLSSSVGASASAPLIQDGIIVTSMNLSERLFDLMANDIGLGWTGGIIATTFLLRSLVTLPLYIRHLKLNSRMEIDAQPQIQAWAHRIRVEIMRSHYKGIQPQSTAITMAITTESTPKPTTGANLIAFTEEEQKQMELEFKKRMRKKLFEIQKEHGNHPLTRFLIPLSQIPLWIIISLSLRRMTDFPIWSIFLPSKDPPSDLEGLNAGAGQVQEEIVKHYPLNGLSDGGFLWFTDLTIADPTWIFPIFIGASYLLNIQLGQMNRKTEMTMVGDTIIRLMRIGSVFMIFISAQLPMAVTLYWATSSGYSLLQNLLFKSPKVKKLFGIRSLPNQPGFSLSSLFGIKKEAPK